MFDLNSYGKTASFEVYPVSVLGDGFKGVKVLSVIDYDTARMYADINSLAVIIYPTLPVATPKDFKKYKYLKVAHHDESVSCIALEWINLATVKFHNEVIVNIRVKLDDSTMTDTIRKLLLANNIVPMEMIIE